MAKQPRQGGRPIERRNGLEGFSWEGVATKVDPAASPPNRPRDLVNTRIQGGVIISRPGFQGEGGYVPLIPEHFTTDVDLTESPPFEVQAVSRWVPHWLADHASAAGVRLWMTGEPIDETARLSFMDTDADAAFQSVAAFRFHTNNLAIPIEKFNNEFYFGDFGGLRKLYLVPSREGAPSPPVNTDELTDDVIVDYPGYATMALQEHEGKLFFAIGGAPNGEVFTWDGLTVNFEFALTATGLDGAIAAVYKDTLVIAVRDYVAPGQGALLVRDAAGAWTTHTLVGFNPVRFPNGIAEYGNLLYILDGVDQIFTWDGATIALFDTVAASTGLNVCAKLAGRLYFSYVDGGTTAELGFVDQDNAPGSQVIYPATRVGVRAVSPGISAAMAMAQYRGRLWLAFTVFGSPRVMWHSQQFVPYDNWQESGSTIAFTSILPASTAPITNMRTL